MKKALPVDIFKNKRKSYSNGGISEKYNELLLLHDEGFIDVNMDNPPENLVKVVKRNIFGREYSHIEPVARPRGVGWMYGGCLVSTSDSRFGHVALKLHDRQETPEKNEMYSK